MPSASAQVKRAALCLRRLSCAQPGVRWVPTAEAGVSEASVRATRERLQAAPALRVIFSTVPRSNGARGPILRRYKILII